MLEFTRKQRAATARGIFAAAAIGLGALTSTPVLADHEHGPSRVAQLAMSTSSLWMMEHHQRAIEDSLAAGDLHAAKHEAEELVPWMAGTHWAPELAGPASAATAAVTAVVTALDGGDAAAAKVAVASMGERFHHLHHELMEVVAGGHDGGHGRAQGDEQGHEHGHEHGKKTH